MTPELIFNFISASLDSRITLTRTTDATHPATYVNSSGVIDHAATDQPRFDYDPVTLACRGLLIEESRTNTTKASSEFNNGSYWTSAAVTITANSITSPDGTANAQQISGSSATSTQKYVSQNTGVSAAYTVSVYTKYQNHAFLQIINTDSVQSFANFNVQTGVVGTKGTDVSSSSITNVGGGWYRLTATFTFSSATYRVYLAPSASAAWNAASTTTGGVHLWGFQTEAGAFPTSYIPTTTTALTRNADVATITGTNFSDWWQAGKGGVLVRARPGAVIGTRPWVQFDDGTADNLIAVRGNGTDPELYIVDSTTPQAQIDAGTIAANTDYAMTAWWNTDDCKARLNSGAVVSDTSATIPTVDQMRIGSDGTNYLNGHIASIGYYDRFSSQIYTRRKNKAVFSLL